MNITEEYFTDDYGGPFLGMGAVGSFARE